MPAFPNQWSMCGTHAYKMKQAIRSALHLSRAEYSVMPTVSIEPMNIAGPDCAAPECKDSASYSLAVVGGARVDKQPIEIALQ